MSLYEIEKQAIALLQSEDIPGVWRFYDARSVEEMREDVARYGAICSKSGAMLKTILNAVVLSVDSLAEVVDCLRKEENYAQSDRLRTIVGQLARSIPETAPSESIHSLARGWK